MSDAQFGRYERQCRRLLTAFPSEFRATRGEELITTLLDDAPPNARGVSVGIAVNLVASGARLRAAYAGADRRVSAGIAGGIEMTAIVALGLQAAVAVASVVYFAEYGGIFYLFDEFHRTSLVGAQHLGTWAAVAAVWCLAFVAALWSYRRVAAGLSLLATSYVLVVVGVMIDTDSNTLIIGGGLPGDEFSVRYHNLVATPGLVGIAIVATSTAVIAAIRGRRYEVRSNGSRWWLLAAAGILAVAFSLLGDGNAFYDPGRFLNPMSLPNGGIMDAFEYLWIGALGVALAWSWLDPRPAWGMAIVSLPIIAYIVSALTVGRSTYDWASPSIWWLYQPLIAVTLAIVGLTGVAIRSARRTTRV